MGKRENAEEKKTSREENEPKRKCDKKYETKKKESHSMPDEVLWSINT